MQCIDCNSQIHSERAFQMHFCHHQQTEKLDRQAPDWFHDITVAQHRSELT